MRQDVTHGIELVTDGLGALERMGMTIRLFWPRTCKTGAAKGVTR